MASHEAARIVVIGAGIVGVSTAIWLQRLNHRVVLIDRGEPGGEASYGNGGVLASCSMIPVTVPGLIRRAPRMLIDPGQPLFLRWRHLPRLAPWLVKYLRNSTPERTRHAAQALHALVGDSLADHQALAQGTGAESFVQPCDYLYAYPSRTAFEADRFAWDLRHEHGTRWEEIEGEALHRLEPLLHDQLGFAVRMGNHGRITDPGRYVQALSAHFQRCGGKLIRAEVSDIVRNGGRVVGVRADGDTVPCQSAVLAAGAWSGAIARRMGLAVPLESERGYHIDLFEPNRMPVAPVMFANAKFVATPMENRIRLAGVVEFGGLDAPASKAPFELLLRGISRAMPALKWKGIRKWMGHRPATADSIPVIGPVPGIAGAYCAFGHHHVGLTAGPRTGLMLAQLISGNHPNMGLAPYLPSRFHGVGETNGSRERNP